MRKTIAIALLSILGMLTLGAVAQAQDDVVVGTVTVDPMIVPAEGEYTFTITASGFTPDSDVVIINCTIPGDPVTPDTPPDVVEAQQLQMDMAANCKLDTLTPQTVDSSGGFTAERTATITPNFLFGVGALDRSQRGAALVFIEEQPEAAPVDEGDGSEELPATGMEGSLIAIVGASVLVAGLLILGAGRRAIRVRADS